MKKCLNLTTVGGEAVDCWEIPYLGHFKLEARCLVFFIRVVMIVEKCLNLVTFALEACPPPSYGIYMVTLPLWIVARVGPYMYYPFNLMVEVLASTSIIMSFSWSLLRLWNFYLKWALTKWSPSYLIIANDFFILHVVILAIENSSPYWRSRMLTLHQSELCAFCIGIKSVHLSTSNHLIFIFNRDYFGFLVFLWFCKK